LEGKEDLDPNEILDYNRVKDRPKGMFYIDYHKVRYYKVKLIRKV